MILKKITGIILNQKPHSDFDRVINVFSYEYGLIHIMAKGVRRIKSRRCFHLDLFNLVQMELEQNGASSIKYLREISTLKSFAGLKMSPLSFSAACVIAGFLMRSLQIEFPQKTLFNLTEKTLAVLDKAQNPRVPRQILLTYFLKTLRLLGYLPDKLPKRSLRQILWKTISEIDQGTSEKLYFVTKFANFVREA